MGAGCKGRKLAITRGRQGSAVVGLFAGQPMHRLDTATVSITAAEPFSTFERKQTQFGSEKISETGTAQS
jgi:hypothetical protein